MAAAAAARKWWAVWWRRSQSSALWPAPDISQMTRLSLLSPLLLAGAVLLCAAIGFAVTEISEGHLEAAQHVALQRAVDDFHVEFGDIDAPDDVQLRHIAHRAGLGDLRFDANPTGEAGREVQSLHDARGRIVGWFSWAGGGALVGAMDQLWAFLAAVGAILGGCGFLALRSSQRLVRSLDRSTENLHKLTHEDPMTGLPNHRVMVEALGEALNKRRSDIIVFAIVDLDGFGEINDALGRSGGDVVLARLAEHLRAALPEGARLGRFEEDEFAVIHLGNDHRAAAALVEAVRTAVARPIFVDRMWQITAGIGVAQAPEDGITADDLVRRAGLALRAAKREGKGRMRSFVPQIEADYAERRFLLRELQSAVALQAFDVHYQPVVAAEGGALIGVEALLRWTHPSRGAISPPAFIPLAEESGLMSQLGEIILRRALADGARWPKNLLIAVNLSPLQIRDPWLVDLVGAIMSETGIAPSRVVLEVTEGILIDNPDEALTRLQALRGLGVSIALDDFGTGYSSLSYLQRFPFDRLKIDRAFVASLGAPGNAAAIVQSIVTLGHALGMKVLAEGVESDEQRVLLRLAGCDEMQGYLFARPGPAAEIEKILGRPPRTAAA